MELVQAGRLKAVLKQEVLPAGEFVFAGKVCEGLGPDTIRKLAGELRQEMPGLLLVLGTISDGKPAVVIGIGDRLASEKNLDASKIIREIVAPLIKGGGGGQKTIATAGGQDAGALETVITAVKSLLI